MNVPSDEAIYTRSPLRATLVERLNHAIVAGKGRDITRPDGIQEIGIYCACGMEFIGRSTDDIEAIELGIAQWARHRRSMLT